MEKIRNFKAPTWVLVVVAFFFALLGSASTLAWAYGWSYGFKSDLYSEYIWTVGPVVAYETQGQLLVQAYEYMAVGEGESFFEMGANLPEDDKLTEMMFETLSKTLMYCDPSGYTLASYEVYLPAGPTTFVGYSDGGYLLAEVEFEDVVYTSWVSSFATLNSLEQLTAYLGLKKSEDLATHPLCVEALDGADASVNGDGFDDIIVIPEVTVESVAPTVEKAVTTPIATLEPKVQVVVTATPVVDSATQAESSTSVEKVNDPYPSEEESELPEGIRRTTSEFIYGNIYLDCTATLSNEEILGNYKAWISCYPRLAGSDSEVAEGLLDVITLSVLDVPSNMAWSNSYVQNGDKIVLDGTVDSSVEFSGAYLQATFANGVVINRVQVAYPTGSSDDGYFSFEVPQS